MTTHRNLLIEAGAGTGKTTRLVKAVLEALFVREIPLDQMVALTFTNKAAGELKERVSLALEEVLEAPDLGTLRRKPWWPTPEPTSTLDRLKDLAKAANGVMDRADISTIHSFAYSLLKRYPLAAGINPNSEIDDQGLRFDELFSEAWPAWLKIELGDPAPLEAEWLDLLSRMSLSNVEAAARKLSDFEAPLEKLPLSDNDLPSRLTPLYTQAQALAAAHPGDLNADRISKACEEVLGIASHGAWEKLESLDPETRALLAKSPGSPKSWTDEDIETLKSLLEVADNLVRRGDRAVSLMTELLKPFVTAFRSRLLSEGCLSHSALLFLSRELVRRRLEIREQLKQEIRLILIDEFQDTDPLQAELLLYLAEKPGLRSTEWKDIALEAGKLFIVGDPEQSIYRFRGADIAAYQQIGERVVSQGELQETLETNYRSQAQIIDCVNTAFDHLIQAVPEVSPPYIPVLSKHPHDPATWPVQDVELWIAANPDKQTVEQAQVTEAAAIAAWIHTHVGKLQVPSPDGSPRALTYRDIALIFRTYSPMDRFIQALRSRDIPFGVESERFFFSTPEVTDFINLLRTMADPADELSKVAFLRGPMAGLTDDEILRRHQEGTLDQAGPMEWIQTLHGRLQHEPLGDVLHTIFEDSFLIEFAARSYHGDQTVANLAKLRRILEELSREGDRALNDLLDRLDEFFEDDTLEGESPLADESYDAVRILTIHKAKGLEFPVVFLPSLHSALSTRSSAPFLYDWRKQTLGLEAGKGLSNLDKILLDRDAKVRDAAEQQRILYVAMTRAKQRLVLSGGIDLKSSRSGTFLNRLTGAWGISLSDAAEGKITFGNTHLHMKRLAPVKGDPSQITKSTEHTIPRFDPNDFAAVWQGRGERCKKVREMKSVVTPTDMNTTNRRGGVYPAHPSGHDETDFNHGLFFSDDPQIGGRGKPRPYNSLDPQALGTLLHRFLEHWDFTCKKCDMPAILRQLARPEELDLVDDAQKILAGFIGSPDYQEIAEGEILGREIPFFYSTNRRGGVYPALANESKQSSIDLDRFPDSGRGKPRPYNSMESPLVRGTMDLLYRTASGKLVIGDYKSSSALSTQHSALDYSAQGQAYKEAVRLALSEDAVFKIISLRGT